MIQKVYAIHDAVMGIYHIPQFIANDASAIRSLSDTLKQDKNGLFAGHPEDFTLVRIGEYDDATGCLTADTCPHQICKFSDLVTKE